jgi:hypothetical protein
MPSRNLRPRPTECVDDDDKNDDRRYNDDIIILLLFVDEKNDDDIDDRDDEIVPVELRDDLSIIDGEDGPAS